MRLRSQQSICRPVEVAGIGFLTGADVLLRFLPAPPNHGIAFQRNDCIGSAPIPARIEYTVPRKRRTAIAHQGVTVELTEHVMAALAGLQIDNCLVQLNAPEPPGCDGSCQAFVDALMDAEIVRQGSPRSLLAVEQPAKAAAPDGRSEITARPLMRPALSIAYQLDYGPHSPIPPQALTVEVTPETFLKKLAFSRTFVLESEVAALRAQGYGSRTTARDLLIFGPGGVIDNRLRAPDECARHKILDCIGDFALIGCDLHGHFQACRSGHELNREIIHRVKVAHPNFDYVGRRRVA